MLTWKIVGVSKVSVLYIYIDDALHAFLLRIELNGPTCFSSNGTSSPCECKVEGEVLGRTDTNTGTT